GGVYALGYQAEIYRIINSYGVVSRGLLFFYFVEAVLFGILGHDGDGQDDGDVVTGFAGEHVAAVEFPEIGVTGSLDGVLDRERAGVVGGHRQVPVAEFAVQISEMVGGGAGGLF